MPFELRIEDSFSSAHNLKGYRGRCEDLHGHNWKVEIRVAADKLDNVGLAIDFRSLKKILKDTLDGLDHKYLNRIPYFRKHNPSSENIARYIYEELFARLRRKGVLLKQARVWESENASAIYSP
ncbi:MAG: 6-carboxytetrahydropterin synthase QueD [Candidatus Omnitrophica bacterium]|nr:6-carboxytetrahydropterin synthase QueD [Candidatus Omnitrophota bacterium]